MMAHVYHGEFVKNEFINGKVTFKNASGEYALTYKDGSIAEADIVFADRTTYTGGCKQFGIDGSGTMIFPNKDQFTGAFTNGKRSGKGTYQWNSGDSYDGEWDKDKMSDPVSIRMRMAVMQREHLTIMCFEWNLLFEE